jgi:hypothetical protein
MITTITTRSTRRADADLTSYTRMTTELDHPVTKLLKLKRSGLGSQVGFKPGDRGLSATKHQPGANGSAEVLIPSSPIQAGQEYSEGTI